MQKSVNSVVAKLNNLLVDHFGVAVQYIPITERAPEFRGTLETVKRNAGAPLIVAHNQMIIPMRVDGALVGATRVNEINSLEPRELSRVKDTVDLILSEFLVAQERLERAELTENYLSRDTRNVISFDRRKTFEPHIETGS